MNYKPNKQRKAQRPSKQTTKELAIKIINLANKKRRKAKYKYVIAKELSIRIERVTTCLDKALRYSRNIFNHKQPWKSREHHYYNIKTWEKNTKKRKALRNQKNTQLSLDRAKPIIEFIKDTYNSPLKLKYENGRLFPTLKCTSCKKRRLRFYNVYTNKKT